METPIGGEAASGSAAVGGRATVGRPPSALGLAGAGGAALALGLGHWLAAVYEEPAPVDNVATWVIEHAPGWFVRFGIEAFGTQDKLALGVGIVVLTLLAGAILGRWSWRRRWPVVAGYVGFGLLGWVAVVERPDASSVSAVPILLLSGGAGLGVDLGLRRMLRRAAAAEVGLDAGGAGAAVPVPTPALDGPTRRRFLVVLGGVVTVAVGASLWARTIVERAAVAARAAVRLPGAFESEPPAAASASLPVPGLSPVITPNRDFYRIDTAFTVPRVDPDEWSLEVTGLVREPFTLTFDELLALPMVERHVTLACVSNEVGGDLIGNARWLGVPLADLLERASPTAAAEQVLGVSVDGFTAGFPLEAATDGRVALVAVGMNGEPLPFDHGFPARLVVEGLYGYVSATKWLSGVELTTRDVDGFWIPRGWGKDAPIKTQSRIDVPRTREVAAGAVVVAGVAWAQGRGIERVEVRVDDGPWVRAELADAISDATWVQWRAEVDLAPGEHAVAVRATDGDGEVQTAERSSVLPDGATGHHTVTLSAG